MRLQSLSLINFGVYRGTNRFDFSSSKPVVLIGGMNGRGKTTLLEAVLVALYGPNSSAYIESGYTTFGQYLRAHTNTSPSSTSAAIKLTFSHEVDGTEEVLTVERRWDTSLKHIHVDTTVRRNGAYDAFLTDNWTAYVEDILPRALSTFFFFDGEKIAEMALDGSDGQIRDSIRMLLGVSTVDVLRRDLKTISRRLRKRKGDDASADATDQLAGAVDSLRKRIFEIDEEAKSLLERESALTKSIEALRTDFIAAGGEAAAQRAAHEERLRQIESQLEQVRTDEIVLSSGNAPLIMFYPILPKMLEEAKASYKQEVMSEALSQLDALLAHYGGDTEAIKSFLSYAQRETSDCFGSIITDVTSSDISELSALLGELPGLQDDYKRLRQREELLTTSLAEVRDYLSIAIDESSMNEAQEALEAANRQLGSVKARLSTLKEERSSLNGDYIRTNAEYKRAVGTYLSSLNEAEEDDRLLRYAGLADEILERYSSRLQERKVRHLSETIGECYRALSNKRSLISSISMNPETLEMSYLSPDGSLVDRQSLSAGEKQLMVIATLWALAKCSDKKLPVIIDTPLARLDSTHRMSIVKSYFPFASEQSIILSTDSEVFGSYYDALKPNISDEFTLVYDESTRSTSIKRGYFTEEAR